MDHSNSLFNFFRIGIPTHDGGTMNEVYPILELSLNRKKPMLMIVDELEGEALQAVNPPFSSFTCCNASLSRALISSSSEDT